MVVNNITCSIRLLNIFTCCYILSALKPHFQSNFKINKKKKNQLLIFQIVLYISTNLFLVHKYKFKQLKNNTWIENIVQQSQVL